MEARRPPRTARDWHDRLAARTSFDAEASERAIRRAYRASRLREPSWVWWVKGPTEAARAVGYIEQPPRRLLWSSWSVVAMGAAAALILSLAFDGSTADGTPAAAALLWSAVLAAGGLAIGGTPRLPEPPAPAGSRHARELAVAGAASFLVLAAYAFVLQRLGGLPDDETQRHLMLMLAVAVGTLPGLFFRFRIRCAYAHLPRPLLDLSATTSVSRRMERRRLGAWKRFAGPRRDDSLVRAHQRAHREAFARQPTTSFAFGRLHDAPVGMTTAGLDLVTAGLFRDARAGSVGLPPRHVDGVEDAAQAAANDGPDASATAADFIELAFRVDRLYAFASVALAVQPPTVVELDADGRLHAEAGPALAWADGSEVHVWHGRLVSREVLDPAIPVTHCRISRELDPERRSVLIERYGLGRYMLEAGAAELHADGCGRLYRLRQSVGEAIQAVRVVNGTPEPDGEFREFWLRVPPTLTTARQAVAWTFGLQATDYDPIDQS